VINDDALANIARMILSRGAVSVMERTTSRKGQWQNADDFENGSDVPREMGINERAINRVNGRRHAILPRRRFQGDGLLTGAD